jgi:hypothetical protein
MVPLGPRFVFMTSYRPLAARAQQRTGCQARPWREQQVRRRQASSLLRLSKHQLNLAYPH